MSRNIEDRGRGDKPATKTCVIAGALGISGRALLEHLENDPAWRIIALSRRAPEFETRAQFVSVDLLDADSCRARLSAIGDVTHIFFSAHTPAGNPAEEVASNLAMLRNLVTAVEQNTTALRHVVLLHGTKWYGNHLGPFKTPAREDDPRHMPPNFYYAQQDWIEAYQKGKPWNWTSLRPHCICGFAVGSPMSHLLGLSIYATISRELGLPLRFPGSPAAFGAIYQYTDASLLARAMVWATTEARCRNEAFNLTNGEAERWENVWPTIAEIFGMKTGPVQTISLTRFMADKEPLWTEIQQKYGLKRYPLSSLVDWGFMDWAYSSAFDQLSSLGKARRAGWTETLDADEMFGRQIGRLVGARIIPPAG